MELGGFLSKELNNRQMPYSMKLEQIFDCIKDLDFETNDDIEGKNFLP